MGCVLLGRDQRTGRRPLERRRQSGVERRRAARAGGAGRRAVVGILRATDRDRTSSMRESRRGREASLADNESSVQARGQPFARGGDDLSLSVLRFAFRVPRSADEPREAGEDSTACNEANRGSLALGRLIMACMSACGQNESAGNDASITGAAGTTGGAGTTAARARRAMRARRAGEGRSVLPGPRAGRARRGQLAPSGPAAGAARPAPRASRGAAAAAVAAGAAAALGPAGAAAAGGAAVCPRSPSPATSCRIRPARRSSCAVRR